MKIVRNSKRGSSTVFMSVILAALITVTMALIYGVRETATASKIDGIVSLAGDSVTSEFNYYVMRDYGIYMICGTDKELTKKLREYVNFSVSKMQDVEIKSMKASGSRYSVSDMELLKTQILEHVKYLEANNIIDKFMKTDAKAGNDMENATLRNGATIVSLPSGNIPEKSLTTLAKSIAENAGQIDEVFKSGGENYMINRYIIGTFNSRTCEVDEEHFFKNEMEYILGGEMSDEKNEKKVKRALKALRVPLNLAYLYSDKEKRTALLAAAELITPGAAALATQFLLATTWAYAEADNDVELLWEGHKVPVTKDDSTWAVDMDSALEGITGGTVYPKKEKGRDYSDYLQVLLYFKDENVKMARILDLIQINMRKNFEGDFLVSEHAAGIHIDVKANGKQYSYEKKY